MAEVPLPQIERAQRFPIAVAVHYRSGETHDWLYGRTVNISRTGVLFHSERIIPAGSFLDMELDLHGVTLAFQGSVVRSTGSAAAVKFHRHNLSRTG